MGTQPQTLENLTKAQRQEISRGIKLFIQKELEIMEESGPNPTQPTTLYELDALIKIAQERDYIDEVFKRVYCNTRNKLMKRYSDAEGDE